MNRKLLIVILVALVPVFFAAFPSGDYVILGWNDLGMHCANKNNSKFTILPPYNNLMVQVIKRGDANNMPHIVTGDYKVTYEVPGNTYSVGKTDFWTYANALYGVTLAPNIGFSGAGLSGDMDTLGTHFQKKGIPITAYPDTDLITEHPYQLALMKAYDVNNNLLAETQNVIPVSSEINCVSSGCHSSEQNVLNSHESVSGFNANGPNRCSKCHPDNASPGPNTGSEQSLSYVIHYRHRNLTSDCYKCHPGPNTQCYRDAMFNLGYTCQSCHGTMANIASTIQAGRQPWLQEPTCFTATCHNANHAQETGKLYRESKGHGGLYCSACHGSPHAIVPTNQPNDNLQNMSLQGFAGKLMDCTVCHGVNPTMPGPHGALAIGINPIAGGTPSRNGFSTIYPNPVTDGKTQLILEIKTSGNYRIVIIDMAGKQIAILAHRDFNTGTYRLDLNTSSFAKGAYLASLTGSNVRDVKKFIVE
ncbi:MAG: T9SS type A sorting domain-containing protein [Bacteroidota bacterium]